MTFTPITVVGYAGTLLILSAYLLVSRGALNGRSLHFQLLNFVGSAALLGYSLSLKAYALVLLNGVWMCVSLVTIFNITTKKKGKQKT